MNFPYTLFGRPFSWLPLLALLRPLFVQTVKLSLNSTDIYSTSVSTASQPSNNYDRPRV
jgi:hypothetical protein